jgi:predicted transcriptional regulator
MPRGRAAPASGEFAGLRRAGGVTELLFLYECTTLEPLQLRPIAERLGLTVQAASHTYRSLSRRGLVEHRDGRYRPTVRGTAFLQESLAQLGEEVRTRLGRLDVVRSCRAVALAPLGVGERVSLELVDGLLSARPGATGPSRGTVLRAARRGSLVEIGQLEGIVPLSAGAVHVRTLSPHDLTDARLPRRLRALVQRTRGGWLGAQGLEAYQVLRSATDRPIVRFAVGAAAREASQLGVPSTLLVLEGELPRLLAEFGGTQPPPLDVTPLA